MALTTDRRTVEDAASRWLAEHRTGDPAAEAASEFDLWVRASPAHADAYRSMEDTLADIESMDELRALPVAGDPIDRPLFPWGRRGMAGALLALCLIVLSATVLLAPGMIARPTLRAATATGEIRTIALADGTRVTLGARSRIKAYFTPERRRVALIAGEAIFDVAHPRGAAPFEVEAAGMTVRDIGTRFNVRLGAGSVAVTVDRGEVQVSQARASLYRRPPALVLRGGESGTMKQPSLFVASAKATVAQSTAETRWAEGMLSYRDAPLAEIAADLDRYVPGGVTVDEAAGALKLATSFKRDAIGTFFSTLPVALPVAVERATDGGYRIAYDGARAAKDDPRRR